MKMITNLKDTIDLMQSDNYKDRFKTEYYQTKIRYERLHKILIQYKAGTLPFDLKCPIQMLIDQSYYMSQYLRILEIRAEIEEIDLSFEDNGTIDFPNSNKQTDDGSDPFDE